MRTPALGAPSPRKPTRIRLTSLFAPSTVPTGRRRSRGRGLSVVHPRPIPDARMTRAPQRPVRWTCTPATRAAHRPQPPPFSRYVAFAIIKGHSETAPVRPVATTARREPSTTGRCRASACTSWRACAAARSILLLGPDAVGGRRMPPCAALRLRTRHRIFFAVAEACSDALTSHVNGPLLKTESLMVGSWQGCIGTPDQNHRRSPPPPPRTPLPRPPSDPLPLLPFHCLRQNFLRLWHKRI